MKLLLLVGPLGFRYSEVVFLEDDKDIDLLGYTRGEGQALLFDLIDYDTSNEFSKAMKDGRFMKDMGNRRHEISLVINKTEGLE